MPVGFENKRNNKNWIFYHFKYYNILEPRECFIKKTKPMLLIRNVNCYKNNAIIHSSTDVFLDVLNDSNLVVEYTDSKCLAYDTFKDGNHRYCIISKDVYEKSPFGEIINEFYPTMIWIVYFVKGGKKNDKIS